MSFATTKIAERFAGALFELASAENMVEPTSKSLQQLAHLVEQEQDLAEIIANPALGREAQTGIMQEIGKKLNVSKLVGNFLGTLGQARRLNLLGAIAKQFSQMAESRAGIVTANVTTAHALSPEQSAALIKELSARMGKQVKLETKINPEILGGIMVQIGSTFIDNSLSNKLSRFQLQFKGA
ncbi:MAG: F0F1 ATP synthase subunit delta [Dongiaceae bacterium]